MIIGLLGFEFCSPNKGCEALSYAFVEILVKVLNIASCKIYVFTNEGLGDIPNIYSQIEFEAIPLNIKDPLFRMIRAMGKCHIIFDVTMGDSFSDIYSKRQCFRNMRYKKLAEIFSKNYILLPQTYGPFFDKKVKVMAADIVSKANAIFCRDEKSFKCLLDICKGRLSCILVTDLAFYLPYSGTLYNIKSEKIKIGFNVSGLLWRGGFSGDNQFNMTFNYCEFVERMIAFFSKSKNYIVYLIPHVLDKSLNSYDDDYKIIKALNIKYKNTILAPYFGTPVQAKSYISNMDCFIGSRMHSTIAAISTGIPTIPVSYSRKFEGLFESLHYKYVIHGNSDNLESACSRVISYVENLNNLKEEVSISMKIVAEKQLIFEEKLATYFNK